MKKRILITSALFIFLHFGLMAQKKECQGQLSLAEDFYSSGDFEEATPLLEQYRECLGTRTSEYYKLSAQILIAQDNIQEATKYIAGYVGSKAGNYISDDDPQLFKDLFYKVRDSINGRQITSVSKRPEDV